MTTDNSTLTEVLRLSQKGIRMFPCWHRDKKPLVKWSTDATTDEKTIRGWFERWPNANWAAAMGERSGLFVLDVDIGKGKDGEAALVKLISEHGLLPTTLEVRTPSGGRHLHFKHPGQKIGTRTNHPAPALDVRGDGGYALVPPSRTENGAYTYANEADPAQCPDWLLALLMEASGQMERLPEDAPSLSRFQRQGRAEEENRIRSALPFIPADDRDTWITVGMALKSWDQERGLAVWGEWSQSCPEKYKEKEIPEKWAGFKAECFAGVTLGTLYALAKDAGWSALGKAAGNDVLVLPSGEVTITETAEELFGRIAPTMTLFTRGGVVTGLVKTRDGERALDVLKPAGARSTLERYGRMMAWRVGKDGKSVLKPAIIPEDMARALLESEPARTHLPRIHGLINCPIMVNLGEIVGPGYHAQTGLFITGGELPPVVGLAEAVTELKELVVEFDFQTPGDKSRALASFITPALKLGGHLRGTVPADVAEADKSQSGKTYRQKIVAACYNEKVSLVTSRAGGVGSTDESFNAKLIAGRPFIQWDNFRGKLDSPHLEAFLTAEKSFPARVPHNQEVEIDPSRFFVFLTSNGVETTRDFANRSCIIRIRKREGFKFRRYPEGDLLDHVRARQPFYLGCIFAVVAEWIAQGRQHTDETRHDFREWCGVLDWNAQKIFREAPLMDGHQTAQERVSDTSLTFLRKLALAVADQGQTGKPLTASQLYEIAETAGVEVPGLRQPHQESGKKQIGIVLGRLFKDCETVDTEGFAIQRKETPTPRKEGGTYMSKNYTFTSSAQTAQPAQDVKCQGKQYRFPESIGACAGCASAEEEGWNE